MAARNESLLVVIVSVLVVVNAIIMIPASAQLTANFYEKSCPQPQALLDLIRSVVENAAWELHFSVSTFMTAL
ncbi:hypothetical protein L484_024691 [Morus notabilis]|uniref:Uncharacterized protein n=1 Tax=Morus notabilis TaxID=981085 RepID=W9RFB2_9ROSA|nr:hypothetical protein L484_024691 [Morus notabilis]